jgi:hypothetical protein
METPNRTEADSIIEQMKSLGAVQPLVDGKAVALPAGLQAISLKPFLDTFLDRPERRAGVQRLDDLESFIAWTKRHQDKASTLFCEADREHPKLVAAIDYHEAEGVDGVTDGKARWIRFGATHPMTLDDRWLAWRQADGQSHNQAEFAAFLEDHALDLCPFAPNAAAATDQLLPLPADVQDFLNLTGGKCGTPAEIVALAQGLDVAVAQNVVNKIRLQSGEHRIEFGETHQTSSNGTQVTVPPIFLIAIPVFGLNPAVYRLPVRLRYRVDGGKVLWFPTLWRADETLDQAIRDAADRAQVETKLPLFYGASPFKSGQ